MLLGLHCCLRIPLPACGGTRGSIAVSQLLFPLQNMQPEQRKSLVTELKVDEKMGGRAHCKMPFGNCKK